MKLLAGLGNPGYKYEGTPHNVGFKVMDVLAEELGFSMLEKNLDSLSYKKSINGDMCFFIKPQTYMNRSGNAVANFVNYFKVPIENILVISDDINMKALKYEIVESAIKAIDAGCNLALYCQGKSTESLILLKNIPPIDEFTRKKTSEFYKFLR